MSPRLWGVAGMVAALAHCAGPRSKAHLAELSSSDYEDPDPDNDKDAPKLCDPSRKTGADLVLCHEQNDAYYRAINEEAKKGEPWFNFPEDSWLESTMLTPQSFVAARHEKEAERRLDASPVVPLEGQDVEYFAGRAVVIKGASPYLVRALTYSRDKGAFTVLQKNDALYVRSESSEGKIGDEIRAPLVVWLPMAPKVLFVDCELTLP